MARHFARLVPTWSTSPYQDPAEISVVQEGITVLQLNVEGLTKPKVDVIEYVTRKHKPTVILLQETHQTDSSRLKVNGYQLAGWTASSIDGIATFVNDNAKWMLTSVCPLNATPEWIAVEVEGTTTINIYKPPPSLLAVNDIPKFSSPCIYSGDFNCHGTAWGYQETDSNDSTLEEWASATDVLLLFDSKQPASFRSGRWNKTSNPDLAFIKLAGSTPMRKVLDPFPRSQHRPSLIIPTNPVEPVPTRAVKR